MVLFQNRSHSEGIVRRDLAEMDIESIGRKRMGKLNCQEIIPYIAVNAKKQVLPGDIKTNIPFNYEEGELEKLISTARSMVTLDPLTSKYLIDPKVPPWAGIHALLSDKQLSLKNVGFLPIIRNLVTRHDTVFTCLRNFSSICSNLDQEVLPVACDEGVYQYVVDIYLCNPDIFHGMLYKKMQM